MNRAPLAVWLVAPLLLACGLPASAQESPGPPTDEAAEEPPPRVPRPEFMQNRKDMPEAMLANKREGWYLTVIPAIAWDAEDGVSLGAYFEIFDNGARDDAFFRPTPYRKRFTVGGLWTTENVARFRLNADLPYVAESPFRVRLETLFEVAPRVNYYGVGDDAMRSLRYPGDSRSFKRQDDYQDALERAQLNGLQLDAYSRYVEYESRIGEGRLSVERDLLGGWLRPLLGLRVGHHGVDDYTGRSVRADYAGQSVLARQVSTKLREDHDAGRIAGFDGGWDNALRLGLTFDTRDFEPNPTEGLLLQVGVDLSSFLLGSDFDYQRVTLSASGYVTPFEAGIFALTLAGRLLYTMNFGEVPFFSLRTQAYTVQTSRPEGLGGRETLRGYKSNRFVGQALALAAAEARFSFAEAEPFGQHLRFYAHAFAEAGRAYDAVQLDMRGWQPTFGGGLKLAWNVATVVVFELGVSREEPIFYMDLSHSF